MDNHYHVLLRSLRGQISHTIQCLQDSHARWFNVRHDRDGPLFKGRFTGKLLLGETSRRAVIGYIHDNPVRAGIVDRADAYPYSSAADYARATGRAWLSRQFGASLPAAVLHGRVVPADLVEAWIADARPFVADLDHLVVPRPAYVRRWLAQNALQADGRRKLQPLVRAKTVIEVIHSLREREPGWAMRVGERSISAWDVMLAGLLRVACALPLRDVGQRTAVTVSTAHGRVRMHVRLMAEEATYAHRTVGLLRTCLRTDYGPWATARGAGRSCDDISRHDERRGVRPAARDRTTGSGVVQGSASTSRS
jgi:hypothetical protein